MTSSYGLTLGLKKDPERLKKGFWKARLSKLLIPMFLANVLRVFVEFIAYDKLYWMHIISIRAFVRQLLFFYLIYWIVFRWISTRVSFVLKSYLVCVAVVLFSFIIYFFNDNGVFAWPVESFGFVYGILLAIYKDKIEEYFISKHILKATLFGGFALISGVLYLKLKTIDFWGDYVIRTVLGALILTFILALNSKFSVGNFASRFLGKISYEVYLLHDIVTFTALGLIPLQLNSGIFIILSIIITVLIGSVVRIISKPIILLFSRNKSKEQVVKI